MKMWQSVVGLVGIIAAVLGIAGYSLRDLEREPTIVEFNAEPQTVMPGERVTLRWQVTNAEGLSIEPDIGGVAAFGTHSVVVADKRTYTLIAKNRNGMSTRLLLVAPGEPPVPSVQVTVTPSVQLKGERVVLDWTATDADTVTIEGLGAVPTIGSQEQVALESRTYEARATNRFRKMAVARANLVVQDWPQPTISLRAVPNPVVKGRPVVILWEAKYAKSLVIEPLGALVTAGERTIQMENSLTLQASVEGPGGNVHAELFVEALPAISVVIPRNQEVRVAIARPLGSAISRVEEEFDGTLSRDLRVGKFTIAPKGARTWGRVTSIDRPGRVRGKASIELMLERIALGDGSVIGINSTSEKRDRSNFGKDVLKVLTGVTVGVAVGALVDGREGAVNGSVIGGAAGAGASAVERGDEVVLPAGYEISFHTRSARAIEIAGARR